MRNYKLKTTKVTVAAERRAGWQSRTDFGYGELIAAAQAVFGPPGVQPGRRWFHKTVNRMGWYRTTQDDNKWTSAPHTISRLDFYFRDPKDATWFNLKFSKN